MSTRPPWEDYQKKPERPPWEYYRASKTELEPERYREPQGFLETMGAMATGESEGLEAQAKGGLTGLGIVAPVLAPVALPAGGALATAAKVLSDPKISVPLAFGYELMRSGDLKRAAGAASMAGGGAFGLGRIGKALAKRALTREAAEASLRANAAAKAAAKQMSTTAAPVAGPASATGRAPVIPFPTNPQQAAIAMRVPARAPAPVSAPAATPPTAAPAAPIVAKPIPPKTLAKPESSTLEQQLQASLKLPKAQKAQLANANALEARIVNWKTEHGQSEGQMIASLRETYGQNLKWSEARDMVRLVLKTHGLDAPIKSVAATQRNLASSPVTVRSRLPQKAPGAEPQVEILVKPDAYGGDIELLPGAKIRFTHPGGGWQRHEAIDHVRNKIQEIVTKRAAQTVDGNPVFYRFTNDPKEMLRQAAVSRNYRDNLTEKGLSVSQHPGYSIWGYKHGYRVTGKVVGRGSDGEPLLDPQTVVVLDKAPVSIKKLDSYYRAGLKRALDSIGWTEDQYFKALQVRFEPYP